MRVLPREAFPKPRGRGRPVGADSRRTRQRLLDVAHQVIAERGFADATIREIADRADVNAALIHYYFGTKAGVRRAVIKSVHERLRAALEQLPREGDAQARLCRLVCTYLRIVVRQQHLARMVLHELVSDPTPSDPMRHEIGELMVREVDAILREGQPGGVLAELPTPVRPVVANVLLFGLVAPWIESATTPPSEPELFDFACVATDFLLHGVAPRAVA